MAARPDAIVATGRSDYPNQVNNVLGFPFIFRGALDVRATTINDEMKLAATRALAALAKEDVPDSVLPRLRRGPAEFGRQYIIPKPFDPRVLIWEAAAVAQAAMETGVAQNPVDLEEYKEQLERRLGKAREAHARDDSQGAASSPSAWCFRKARRIRSCAPARSCWTKRSRTPSCWASEPSIAARIDELHLHLEGVEIDRPGLQAPNSRPIPRSFSGCASARASPPPKLRRSCAARWCSAP